MIRFYLRLVLSPLVIFIALTLLIRAQPYDDRELRQLLLPAGCPAPCFMGIRPGETSMEEALTILKSNQWIGDIRTHTGSIEWTWSDSSPHIIDRKYPGYAQHSNVPGEECCVGSFKFNSLFTLGDLYLLLGEPPRTNAIRGTTIHYALVSISYVDQSIRLFTSVDCPISREKFWQAQLETYIESKSLYKREGGMSARINC